MGEESAVEFYFLILFLRGDVIKYDRNAQKGPRPAAAANDQWTHHHKIPTNPIIYPFFSLYVYYIDFRLKTVLDASKVLDTLFNLK
jgi:hypothetical protein